LNGNDDDFDLGGDVGFYDGEESLVDQQSMENIGANVGQYAITNLDEMMLSEKNVFNELYRSNENNGDNNNININNADKIHHGDYTSFMQAVNSELLGASVLEENNIWEPLDPHTEDNSSKKPFKLSMLFIICIIVPFQLYLLLLILEHNFRQSTAPKSDPYAVFDNKIKKLNMSSLLSIRNLQKYFFEQGKLTHLFPAFTYEMTQYSKLNFNSTYHPEFNDVLVLEKRRRKEKNIKRSNNSDKFVDLEQEEDEDIPMQYQNGYINDPEDIINTRSNRNLDDLHLLDVIPAEQVVANKELHLQQPDNYEDFGGNGDAVGFDNDGDYDFESLDQIHAEERQLLNNSSDDILSQSDSLSSAFQSYEDLCKKHLEEYMRSTDRYMQDIKIVQRVNEWQNRITPFLEEQAQREKFNIQKYSETILEEISVLSEDDKPQLEFKRIAQSKPKYEICRLFLATLQLANMGNIHIQENPSNGDLSAFSVKLVSKEIQYEDFNDLISIVKENTIK
jgi:hypothetical protein